MNTGLTLALFLLLRLPGVWQHTDFSQPWRGPGSWIAPTGLAMFVAGIAILTTPFWAGPSHMLNGYNLVDVIELPLQLAGWAMTMEGGLLVVRQFTFAKQAAPSVP